jgi:hypothetical protein
MTIAQAAPSQSNRQYTNDDVAVEKAASMQP